MDCPPEETQKKFLLKLNPCEQGSQNEMRHGAATGPGHPLSPMNLFFPTRFEETETFHSLQPTFLYYRFFSSDSSTSPLTARPPRPSRQQHRASKP